jgi:iron complex outermembrane receptor protein
MSAVLRCAARVLAVVTSVGLCCQANAQETGTPPPEPIEPEPVEEPAAPSEPEAPPTQNSPSTPESAAEGAEPSATGEAALSEEVVAPRTEDVMLVTGSRIKRNSFDTPTPVQVVDREQIARSGATNMADLIRILTANSGSETQFGLGNGSTGSSQFNLRGLGIANTLTLVNGRRLVSFPDAFGVTNSASFADVNQIPLAFVERIEIAKGGASAIYGSDAIAGVVNIILRNKFEGAAFTLSGQTTDRWDQQDGEVAAILGARGEKSSVVGQFSYFRRAPLAAKDRDFTAGTLTSTVGSPGTFILPGSGSTPTTFRVDEGCGAAGSDSYVDPGANPDSTNDDRCRFDFRRDWNLYNQEERILGYVTASHEAAEFFEVFTEFGFARKDTTVPQSPSYPLLRSVTIPADHVDNPYGQSAVFLGRPFGRAAGSQQQQITVDGYRAVGGLKGDLDKAGMEGWSYDSSVTWHMNEFLRRNADILFDRFQESVRACNDPNDLTRCFNPWYTAVDGTGTKNSAEVVDYITGQVKAQNTTKMLVGDLSLAGPLFSLPGGDFSLAFGGQVRRNEQFVDNDNDFEDVAYAFTLGDKDWRGKQLVYAAFAELSMPFAKGLEVQAAVRAEHYQGIATTVNPRGAISWAPGKSFKLPVWIAGFRLRGSVGTAFRAPNLLQTNGTVTNLEQFVDPSPVFRGVTTVPNPDLKPEKSLAYSAGFEWNIKSLSMDFDYWQYNVEDLIIRQSAQAYLAQCRGAMSSMGSSLSGTPECANLTLTPGTENWESMTVSYANQDHVTTNGIDFMLNYKLGLGERAGEINAGAGGTFTISYMVPATSVPELSVTNPSAGQAGQPPTVQKVQSGCDGATTGECNLVGKRNQNNFALPLPAVRMRFPLSWGLAGHVVSLAVNYISSYEDDATYDPISGKQKKIDAWTTLDIGYSYSMGKTPIGSSTQFRVGVNNAIGSDPPRLSANTNFGYDIYTHDPRRRLLYANLTHKF